MLKLKKRYIRKINGLRDYAKGWPLSIIMADRHPRYNTELTYHKKYDSYCRSKAGRLDGSYEEYFGKKPTRISLGK